MSQFVSHAEGVNRQAESKLNQLLTKYRGKVRRLREHAGETPCKKEKESAFLREVHKDNLLLFVTGCYEFLRKRGGNVIKISEKKLLKKMKNGEVAEFVACPNKCSPSSVFSVTLTLAQLTDENTKTLDKGFTQFINNFSYYNCSTELGTKINFYVKKEKETK